MSADSGENRLRPVIIVFNALIYVMFIILLVLYFILPDPISRSSCLNEVNVGFFSPKVIVAIAFKVILNPNHNPNRNRNPNPNPNPHPNPNPNPNPNL